VNEFVEEGFTPLLAGLEIIIPGLFSRVAFSLLQRQNPLPTGFPFSHPLPEKEDARRAGKDLGSLRPEIGVY